MFSLNEMVANGGLVFRPHFQVREQILSITLSKSFSSSWLLKESLRMERLTVSSITSSSCYLRMDFILSITQITKKVHLWLSWNQCKSRRAFEFIIQVSIFSHPSQILGWFEVINFTVDFYFYFTNKLNLTKITSDQINSKSCHLHQLLFKLTYNLILLMTSTPPKIPPLLLSPKHQISLDKSKPLDKQVQAFIQCGLQNPPDSNIHQMEASSCSLSNTKAFFESQISLVLKMLEQSNKLYKQKQNENEDLKKRLNQYEGKITQLQKATAKQTVNKSKNPSLRLDQKDESKTKKKTENEDLSSKKPLNSVITQFNLCQSKANKNEGLQMVKSEDYRDLQRENSSLKRINQSLEEQLKWKTQHYESTRKDYKKMMKQQEKVIESLARMGQENRKISTEYDLLQTRYKTVEKQYHDLEDKYGKTVSEYEIKIQNLRELLRGIKDKNSPRKNIEKHSEGYYSINKPLNRNESQQSFGSSNASKSFNLSYVEVNLKEENEYLRAQLIKVLDEKGAIQTKLTKYKKLVEKHEGRIKQEQNQQNIITDENNQSLSNINQPKWPDKSSFHSFKKNKNPSILVVQNTEKKEKQFIEQQKTWNLLKQMLSLLSKANQQKTEDHILSKYTQFEILEILTKKLRENVNEGNNLISLLKNTQAENQKFKKQKHQFEQNSKNDSIELRSFLKQITEIPSQTQSRDSTDQTFKNIKLIRNQQIGRQKIEFEASNNIFELKQKDYIQKINGQANQIINLKNVIFSLEEMNESLYKLTSQSHSQSQMKVEYSNREEIIPYCPVGSLKDLNLQDSQIQLDPFEFFKLKITQFYQNTIKELDEFSTSIQKNVASPSKRLRQIKLQNSDSLSNQVPQIVQRNILKISQQFKSIKNSSFDQQSTSKNEEYENQFFKNQKMSKSFIGEERKIESAEETLEDIINKRLTDFQEFSSQWIEKVIAKDGENQVCMEQNKSYQDETIKQGAKYIPEIRQMNASKTERLGTEKRNNFELELNEIDARSDSINESEMLRQRQVFIREEISYYVKKNESFTRMLESANSRRSYESFRI